MSKFASMSDFRKQQDKDKDDDVKPGEKKGKESFVGGGASGLNVVDRGSGKPADLVDRIVSKTGDAREEARANISITFYKNGFVLDEGELRPYEDPANRAFLDAIDRGEMPAELGAKVRTGEIGVDVQNRRTEDYVAPPYRAFSGAGSSVGAGSAAPTTAVFAGAGSAVPVDESKPTATIQVKLVDGRRERVVLNLSHTVADLQARVAVFKATTKSFVLLAGFPPKPLATPSATIEAAGLKGAAVTQKEA